MEIEPIFPVGIFGQLALVKHYPEPGSVSEICSDVKRRGLTCAIQLCS